MEQVILTPIEPQSLINRIAKEVTENILEALQAHQPEPTPEQKDFLSEYIPKSEVRGKLASSSTLWHWEKEGKLKAYGVGAKRYYKRADINALFTEIQH